MSARNVPAYKGQNKRRFKNLTVMSYKGNTQVQLRKPTKSIFDLSHEKKLSTRMGRLTPVLIQEAIPGDVFRGSSEILLRMAPLLAPIYDSIQMYVHYFFVPNRLLWSQWEEFITGGRLGVGVDPLVAPIPPRINIGEMADLDPNLWKESSIADYLGVPTLPDIATSPLDYESCYIDAMPFGAYYLTWYHYYRDRNYNDDYADGYFPMPSGTLDTGEYQDIMYTRIRDYRKGYFEAALPWTQRGQEVLMPLQGSGSVTYNPISDVVLEDGSLTSQLSWSDDAHLFSQPDPAATDNARIENINEVLLTNSEVSINDLRSAVRLQEWLERNAVAGSRYTESIQAHFAVRPQDSRLQRPEFLGGGRIPVKISEVVTTAFSKDLDDNTVPAANLNGHGVTYGNTNSFKYFCPEHGFIIGILSIMAPPSYFQGLPRMFKRPTFLDYPWPTFAQLGEQVVNRSEVYADSQTLDPTYDDNVFGYQSRYSEWKQSFNTNHGQFRSTLLHWTLARVFADAPELGEQFVKFDDTVQDRIFIATQVDPDQQDNFWLYISNNITVKRALLYFGTPTL